LSLEKQKQNQNSLRFAAPAGEIDPVPLSAYFFVYSPVLFDKIKTKVPCDHMIT